MLMWLPDMLERPDALDGCVSGSETVTMTGLDPFPPAGIKPASFSSWSLPFFTGIFLIVYLIQVVPNCFANICSNRSSIMQNPGCYHPSHNIAAITDNNRSTNKKMATWVSIF